MTGGQTDRRTDRQKDYRRQNDFSAQLSKQKLFRMSTGCQKHRKTEIQTDRLTDRRQKDFSAQLSKQKLLIMSTGCQKDTQTERKTEFFGLALQLSKQKLLRMSTGCQKHRKTERQTDRLTERLFSLVIRTKVVKNVNRI